MSEIEPSVIQSMLIRDLVSAFPDAMPVLSRFGLDLCCGGGHSLADACSAHGLQLSEVSEALQPVMNTAAAGSRS
jgi:regulator of cell morphogenesis and NO signaling